MNSRHVISFMIVALAYAAPACYEPSLRDCIINCGPHDECPSGQTCSAGFCSSVRECRPDGSAEGFDVADIASERPETRNADASSGTSHDAEAPSDGDVPDAATNDGGADAPEAATREGGAEAPDANTKQGDAEAPDASTSEADGSTDLRDLSTAVGKLLPFGGRNDNGLNDECISAANDGSLRVVKCSDSDTTQTLFFDPDKMTISPNSSESQCLSLWNGDISTGTIDMEPCNSTFNQRWISLGGQIQSANTTDGQLHCIGPHFGIDSLNNIVDLGSCDNSQGQSFWITGITLTFASSFTDTANPPNPECLQVKNSSTATDAPLEDALCNHAADSSQLFILDPSHRIQAADNTGQCVVMGTLTNGLGSVSLQPCSTSSSQRWFFVAQNPGNGDGAIAAISNVNNTTCLEIQSANFTPGTLVDAVTCNGTSAQRMQPRVGGTGNL